MGLVLTSGINTSSLVLLMDKGNVFFCKVANSIYIKSTKSTKRVTWRDAGSGSLGRRIHQRRLQMMLVIRITEEH